MADGELLTAIENALVRHYGVRPERASVSFVGVEPIVVLRFEQGNGEQVLATVGVPVTSESEPASRTGDPDSVHGVRVALLLRVRGGRSATVDVWRRLAVLAAAPAVQGVEYREGMSVELGEPLAARSECVGVVVVMGPVPPVSTTYGQLSILQLLPATSTELAWCRVHGSDPLRAHWSAQQTDLLDLTRESVSLR